MIINFRAHGISRGACKLARTPMLIIIIKKKKAIAIQSFLSVDDHVISFVTFYSIEGMTFLLRQRV
jgi:hypothetical protein